MPIRFSCPHCGQKLSIAQRKAGSTAGCPRCKQTLTVPEPPASPPGPSPRKVAAPVGESPSFLPDVGDYDGVELVYDAPASDGEPRPPPAAADTIVVARRVIYWQGALLGLVALVAFSIGLIMGSTFVAAPVQAPHPCQVTGAVTYASGPRRRPDIGAVVILLPQTPHPPDAKIAFAGLRPSDSAPTADAGALATLARLGGSYARTDASGRFELEVPRQGRYLVLVISRDRRATEPSHLNSSGMAKLRPFFDSPSELLADRRYELTAELIRGDQELVIELD
jgi:hypothetical protein